jgi:hypothetical protein
MVGAAAGGGALGGVVEVEGEDRMHDCKGGGAGGDDDEEGTASGDDVFGMTLDFIVLCLVSCLYISLVRVWDVCYLIMSICIQGRVYSFKVGR